MDDLLHSDTYESDPLNNNTTSQNPQRVPANSIILQDTQSDLQEGILDDSSSWEENFAEEVLLYMPDQYQYNLGSPDGYDANNQYQQAPMDMQSNRPSEDLLQNLILLQMEQNRNQFENSTQYYSTNRSDRNPDKLNAKQKLAYDMAVSTKTLFLTGGAGTGKTYTLEMMIRRLYQAEAANITPDSSPILITATTGIAAQSIRGVTLDSAILNVRPTHTGTVGLVRRSEEVIRRTKYLIIDEISMITAQKLDSIEAEFSRIKNQSPFGGVTVIFCGDFMQLQVLSGAQLPAFESNTWKRMITPENTIALTQKVRFPDEAYFKILQSIRLARATSIQINLLQYLTYSESIKSKDIVQYNLQSIDHSLPLESQRSYYSNFYTVLCYTNDHVEAFNKLMASSILSQFAPAQVTVVPIYREGTQIMNVDDPRRDLLRTALVRSKEHMSSDLVLFVGCRVICVHNQRAYTKADLKTLSDEYPYRHFMLYNGMKGTVTSIHENFHRDPVSIRTVYVSWDTPDGSTTPILVRPYTMKALDHQRRRISVQVLPIRLAYAFTIHKSQSVTINKAAIMLNEISSVNSLFYVALSRVPTFESVILYSDKPGVVSPSVFIPKADARCTRYYDTLDCLISESKVVSCMSKLNELKNANRNTPNGASSGSQQQDPDLMVLDDVAPINNQQPSTPFSSTTPSSSLIMDQASASVVVPIKSYLDDKSDVIMDDALFKKVLYEMFSMSDQEVDCTDFNGFAILFSRLRAIHVLMLSVLTEYKGNIDALLFSAYIKMASFYYLSEISSNPRAQAHNEALNLATLLFEERVITTIDDLTRLTTKSLVETILLSKNNVFTKLNLYHNTLVMEVGGQYSTVLSSIDTQLTQVWAGYMLKLLSDTRQSKQARQSHMRSTPEPQTTNTQQQHSRAPLTPTNNTRRRVHLKNTFSEVTYSPPASIEQDYTSLPPDNTDKFRSELETSIEKLIELPITLKNNLPLEALKNVVKLICEALSRYQGVSYNTYYQTVEKAHAEASAITQLYASSQAGDDSGSGDDMIRAYLNKLAEISLKEPIFIADRDSNELTNTELYVLIRSIAVAIADIVM